MKLEHELAVALATAELAGQYIRSEYESFVPVPNAPASISTHVDKGSQELIFQHLHAAFPNDALCGEEDTETPVTISATRTWVIDPIDGTRGFAMKNGEFSVMIGLTINREVVLGVVLEPVTMKYTYASLGGGCWTKIGEKGTPQRCSVLPTDPSAACILVQSRPRPKESPTPVELALKPKKTLEMYSAGVKLAVVARGEADTYVNTYGNFKDWDICAGDILVKEAGGKVTGLKGQPITYGQPNFAQRVGLIASGARIHDSIIEKVK